VGPADAASETKKLGPVRVAATNDPGMLRSRAVGALRETCQRHVARICRTSVSCSGSSARPFHQVHGIAIEMHGFACSDVRSLIHPKSVA